MNDEPVFRTMVAQLEMSHMVTYLECNGWQEAEGKRKAQRFFLSAVEDDGDRYQLYIPASPETPKYRTRLQRAIYQLCAIEDREAVEVVRDVLDAEAPTEPVKQDGSLHLRVRNAASCELQLQIASRSGQIHLLPGEAMELVCDLREDNIAEIEYADGRLHIQDVGRP